MKRRRAAPAKEPSAKALLAALDRLPVAFALFDAERRLAGWNAPIASLGLFPRSLLRQGTRLSEFQRRDAGLKRRTNSPHELKLTDGRLFQATRKVVPPGHLLLTYEDVTDARATRDEAAEALERQMATAEILKVISSSPNDLRPVFDAILEKAMRLCDAHLGTAGLYDGERYRQMAQRGAPPAFAKWLFRAPFVPDPRTSIGRMVRERKPIHHADIRESLGYRERVEGTVKIAELSRARSYLAVPMLKSGRVAGGIVIYRREVRPFTQKQIELVSTFADQAVIAIENVRLFNETKEALERETATSELLKVIGRSTFDLQPVFDTLAENAVRLCEAKQAIVFRLDRQFLRVVASCNASAELRSFFERNPIAPGRGTVAGRAVLDARTLHIHDVRTDPESNWAAHRVDPMRTVLTIPMIRAGEVLGVIGVNRHEVRPFTDKQVTLLETFADQAAIAIENVRLFNETKEALERQTATAEILSVISRSPTDTGPVFDAIIANAVRLSEGVFGAVYRYDGTLIHVTGHHNFSPDALATLQARFPQPAQDESVVARSIRTRSLIEIKDVEKDTSVPSGTLTIARTLGYRSQLSVPMLREETPIGAIVVARAESGGFSERQIDVIQTFAKQAVIAIENVRLFNETKEALERQTATAEVLRVISSSPTSLKPVFDAILSSALRLCNAQLGILNLREGDLFRGVAQSGGSPDFEKWFAERGAFKPEYVLGRLLAERQPVHIADMREVPAYKEGKPITVKMVELGGARTFLVVPLIKDGEVVGNIAIYRSEVRPFTEKQIELVSTFADQAVIAIENVRLFNETKEALERQTATADILRVISRSTTEVQPVFDAIVSSAGRLFNRRASLRLVEQGGIRRRARSESAAYDSPDVLPIDHDSLAGRVILDAVAQQVTDTLGPDAPPYAKENAHKWDFRANAAAPLIRDGTVIGLISVASPDPGALSDKQMALLATFADQAVIAIENVRLFNETKEALERQTATAEILSVIAASPTDTKPVFDAIASCGGRLLGGVNAGILLRRESQVVLVGHSKPWEDLPEQVRVLPLSREKNFPSQVILDGKVLHIPDWESGDILEFERNVARAYGVKSCLQVPLLRKGEGIGTIVVSRATAGPFHEKDIALLKSFADQAVIAIENVRLFNETKEALERQTATADILKVIASSPSDVQPVFDAIARSALELCGSSAANVFRYDGNQMHFAASHHVSPELVELINRGYPRPPDRSRASGRAILSKQVVRVENALADPEYDQDVAVASGWRRMFAVPMLREGEPIGAIAVNWPEPGPIPAHQETLLRTFADQAVIAIENVRLFNETKEALERQTATAEVLHVISSSPTDVQPVFDVIARSCQRLFDGYSVALALVVGDQIVPRAGVDNTGAPLNLSLIPPWPLDRGSATGASVLDNRAITLADLSQVGEAFPRMKDLALRLGYRSGLWVPLRREGGAIGGISILRRATGAFTEPEVSLAQTFADQAVIAIENVRLFNETKEALERQTATAEVLRVISNSPTDTQPVFEAIAQSGLRLFPGAAVAVALPDGDQVRAAAIATEDPALAAAWRSRFPIPFTRDQMHGAAILDRRLIDVPDAEAEVDGPMGPGVRNFLASGNKAITIVPMIRGESAIGAISVIRLVPGPLKANQIALLQTFADQAVIAIENVRLFNETKEGLERQTATAEILKVIASSPSDVQPVFDAIVNSVSRLFNRKAGLRTVEPEGLRRRALSYEPAADEFHGAELEPLDATRNVGRAVLEGRALQRADTFADADDYGGLEKAKSLAFRSIASAPLMRDGKAIGVISVSSPEPGALSDKQMELLSTFADQAVIAIENVRLFNETKEALERQTATAEILKVIASSPSSVQPVFDAIAASARRLLGGHAANVARRAGDVLALAAFTSTGEAGDSELGRLWPSKITGKGHMGKALLSAAPAWVEDIETDPGYSEEFRAGARARGMRSAVSVPMLREGEAIGVISVNRSIPGRFSDHQTNLLQTFADQAVIAIENVRMFNETQEALARQEAAAQVLRSISESVSDTAPVFTAILDCSNRLIPSIDYVQVQLIEGSDRVRLVDHRFGQVRGAAPGKQDERRAELMAREAACFPRPLAGSTLERALNQGRVVILADTLDGPDTPPGTRVEARRWGHSYSQITVPLMREGRCIGAIEAFRRQLGGFEAKESSLLESFADQAVIAIANVRLFNETKEALERQTVTAEILKVISSSPTDTQPVFDAIVESCTRLLACRHSTLRLIKGDRAEIVASNSIQRETADDSPMSLDDDSLPTSRAVTRQEVVQVPDIFAEGVSVRIKQRGEQRGFRSLMIAPLLRENSVMGTIHVHRATPGRFTEKEVALLETFASQAVIAIENVRLFNETREALEQQTATAAILKVISESPTDTKPVFDAIVQSGLNLFPNAAVAVVLPEGNKMRMAAVATRLPAQAEAWRAGFQDPLSRDRMHGIAILDGRLVDVPDAEAEKDGPLGPGVRNFLAGGNRAITIMPMICDDTAIGAISVIRATPGPLSEKQLALLRTFAAQAVIAIENVRLFKELEERTQALGRSVEQLTALGEVGQAISSTLDLEKVLRTIATHAVRLTGLDGASIYEYDEASEEFRLQVADSFAPEFLQAIRAAPIRKGDGTVGGVAITLEPAQVSDILDDSYHSSRKDLLVGAGYRAVLTVPLLREDHIIGALSVTRKTPGPFSEEIVELLKTFATQSAMAIQNARLFREIAEKGKQLEEASKHKSQFLASMSHELRTPLNAILGFNEMILGDVYGEVPADMKEPLSDIQTSGKHLLRLINNVLDLAKIEAGRMELALSDYSVHDTVESVRATLRPLAEAKGLELAVDVPADMPLAHGDSGRITQCLMNLAGNSLKFTKQGSVGISVALTNGTLTYKVRDTGIGIPADKIGSLFTEFKQTDATIASEYGGTGLGLSITKKFIEMHGGRIWAESEPGSGSTFIFELPLRAGEARQA